MNLLHIWNYCINTNTAGIRTGWSEPCRKVWRRYCKDNRQPWTIRRKKAVSLINSYGDDALELFKEGKSADEVKKIVEGGLSETALDSGITQSQIEKIVNTPKGSRPDPASYLSQEYIEAHLAQFDDGASIIMTKEQYINYVKGNLTIGIPTDRTQFVLPKKYCDDIASKAAGNISFYEKALGFDIGHFSDGGGLVRIDIQNLDGLNLRIPSGNEAGANSHWIPGGKTDGGVPEAILDLIPNDPNNVTVSEIKWRGAKMDIENMLLNAIINNDMIKFLRGDGEYLIETSQYTPEAGLTDVGKVLSKGIYKIYAYNDNVKEKFELSLLKMLDMSDFDIYMVCHYVMSQLFKEKNGLSPFVISKGIILDKLSFKINEREIYLKKGIVYPNGYVNTSAMTEIQRFRMVGKEEYNVLF